MKYRNRKTSRRIKYTKSSRKYNLKSKKRHLRKLKTRTRIRRNRHRQSQRGGFLNSVKNLLHKGILGQNPLQPQPQVNTSSKQVLLNTMCEQADDASLQNAPKLSGIINSLCIENVKSNMVNTSMSGGQSYQGNNMGNNMGNSMGNILGNMGGGVLSTVVKAATFPARMGLNVIKNVTGFHGNNLNIGGNGNGKQELVGGDVQKNINKIKENNNKIKSLKAVPKHLLDPSVYDNIHSLNSLEMVSD